jgi:hypothetical protein
MTEDNKNIKSIGYLPSFSKYEDLRMAAAKLIHGLGHDISEGKIVFENNPNYREIGTQLTRMGQLLWQLAAPVRTCSDFSEEEKNEFSEFRPLLEKCTDFTPLFDLCVLMIAKQKTLSEIEELFKERANETSHFNKPAILYLQGWPIIK